MIKKEVMMVNPSEFLGKEQKIETDVLIIGSGLAGVRAAIEARRYGADVLLLDKSVIALNNSSAFSGGCFKKRTDTSITCKT